MYRMEMEYCDGSRWPNHVIIVLYYILFFYNGYCCNGILFLPMFNHDLVNVGMCITYYVPRRSVCKYFVKIKTIQILYLKDLKKLCYRFKLPSDNLL